MDDAEAAQALKDARSLEIHWRRPDELRPLVVVFKADQAQQEYSVQVTAVTAEETRSQLGTWHYHEGLPLAVSTAVFQTSELEQWPSSVSLDLRFPVEDWEVIKTVRKIPDEPITIAEGVSWYVDPRYAQGRLPGKTAGVLLDDTEIDPLTDYDVRIILRNQSSSEVGVPEAGATFKDIGDRRYLLRFSDPIDPAEIVRVDFRRRRFATSTLKDVQLRLDMLAQLDGAAADSVTPEEEPAENAPPYPVIIETNPKNGDLDVDPGLKWVTVTFDRDMGEGMSWTGELPIDKKRKARWTDKRTCRLPVSLKKGQAYRIGINSTSFQNFASQSGEPMLPEVILFVTKGASDAVKQQIAVPKIVALEPANGATDVDPGLTQLKVTFDIPMGAGMSWTGGGDSFPSLPGGSRAVWSEDRRTCTLPVSLQPGHTYTLGINSPRHRNFQSAHGVPTEPVVYEFRTRE